MKIGIGFGPFGKTYGRYGEGKFLKIKQHGYDAVDYQIADTNIPLYSFAEDELMQFLQCEKRAAKMAGIQISQIHGPWRWPPQDSTEEEREERLEKMKKAVVITAMMGCKYLVIHPIMPFGVKDICSNHEQDTWDLNLDFFMELVDFADDYDVTICIENMPMLKFSLSTPEKVLELVKTINKDNFRICLDTGHVAVFSELSIGDEVRRLGSYLKVLHIHDNMGDRDSHLYPTKGIVDWDAFLDAINEIGYNGVLSLETSPSGVLEDNAFEDESVNLYKNFQKLVFEHKKKDI